MKKLTNVYRYTPTVEDTFFTVLSQFDTQITLAKTFSRHIEEGDCECEYNCIDRMQCLNSILYCAGLIKEKLSHRITELIAYKKYKEVGYIITNLKHIVLEEINDY